LIAYPNEVQEPAALICEFQKSISPTRSAMLAFLSAGDGHRHNARKRDLGRRYDQFQLWLEGRRTRAFVNHPGWWNHGRLDDRS
jgi:hypothetical protein